MDNSVRGAHRRRGLIIVMALVAMLGGVMIFVALWPVMATHNVTSGIKAAPAPGLSSSIPNDEDLRPSNRPSNTHVSSPTPTAANLIDPKGKPVKIEVYVGKKRHLAMRTDPNGTSVGNPFESACGMTTWYSAQGWPTPGTLSTQMSLITGHMACKPDVYELDKLRTSPNGAILRVTFDSGDVVIGEAIMKATSIDKTKLNADDKNLYNDKPARVIRLSTCDSTSKVQANGHVDRNIYQMFKVVQVIKK